MDLYLEQIAKGSVRLKCKSSAEGGICHVHLLGTIHLSQESCNRVRDTINNLKPQAIFLELCEARFDEMMDEENCQVPKLKELLYMWIKGNINLLAFLHCWYIIKMQSKMNMPCGAELKVAYEEARKCGAKVYLGNRPINITLDRIWERLTIMQKILLACTYLSEIIFFPTQGELKNMLTEMDRGDILETERSLKSCHPIYEILLQERDMYMSYKLLEVARQSSSVVAVVGKAHLTGIIKYWIRPSQVDVEKLLPTIDGRSSTLRLLVSLGAITGTLIGIYIQWKC